MTKILVALIKTYNLEATNEYLSNGQVWDQRFLHQLTCALLLKAGFKAHPGDPEMADYILNTVSSIGSKVSEKLLSKPVRKKKNQAIEILCQAGAQPTVQHFRGEIMKALDPKFKPKNVHVYPQVSINPNDGVKTMRATMRQNNKTEVSVTYPGAPCAHCKSGIQGAIQRCPCEAVAYW